MIKPKYLEKITKCLNFQLTVDLSAIRLNTQFLHFISLRPDPETKGVNALLFHGKTCHFMAIEAEGILVVLDWPNQLCYTQYTERKIKDFTHPSRPDLLTLLS